MKRSHQGNIGPLFEKHRNKKAGLILVLIIAVYYGLLQNGKWVPSSDGEVYLSIARNLATGRGYTFNGYPVSLIPPGWPVVLMFAMKISPFYAFLNLLPMTFMLASVGVWYLILLRFTSFKRAFIVVLVTSTVFVAYRMSRVAYSDALFCFLFSLAVLLSLQLREKKRWFWRVPCLVVLCSVLITIRLGGILFLPVLIGAIITRYRRPRLDRNWISAGTTTVAMVGTFLGMIFLLQALAEKETPRKKQSPARVKKRGSSQRPPSGAVKRHRVVGKRSRSKELLQHPPLYVINRRYSVSKYADNLAQSGHWVSWFFYAPAEVSSASSWMGAVSNVSGWLLIVLFMLNLIPAARKREWIWYGVILCCGMLCIRWPHPGPRYFLPVAPLLLLGIWQGGEYLGSVRNSPSWRKTFNYIIVLFLISVLICNFAIFAVDVYVARQSDFYGAFRAGQCKDLIASAYYLVDRDVKDNEVAVSQLYLNLNRKRVNRFARRALYLLTNRTVRTIRASLCAGPPNRALVRYAKRHGIKYYLYRPPVVPWRVWHFRSAWLQEKMTGKPVTIVNPYFELYRLDGKGAVKIELEEIHDWPKRIQGL